MILIFYFSFFNFLALSKEKDTSDELKQKDYEANNNLSPHQNSDIKEKSPSKPLISLNQVQKTINFDTGLISESKIINYDKDLKIRKEKSINPEFEATKTQPELLAESNQDYSNGIYENFQGPIYLNDNNPYTGIANSQFIDYQLSDDQYLFIVRKGFTFDHVKFIFNETVTSKFGAIKIECQSEVFIQNCEFIRCNGQNTIYFAPSTMPSKILSERNSIIKLIENCTFFQCIDENSNGFSVNATEADELQIFNCTFNNCGGGIKITESLSSAIIEECKFFDCIDKVLDRAVVEINNNNCIFTKNIVKFSSNENLNSICGLWIRHHGDITVTNNYFYRIRSNAYRYGSIIIEDYDDDGNENDDRVVVFNYNMIEDVGDVKLGTFNIKKKYDFNFDHNIIKNCRINDYSCSIELGNSIKYSHEYQLTNLSLIGCSSNSRTGGGFGIWLVFKMRQGKFIIKNCLFENDHSGPSREGNGIYGGCGGGFHCGNMSISNTSVVIDNCTFKNNSAEYYGGAISLQTFPENEIKNCVFIDNFAPLGGGAIHLSTDYSFYRESPMERCTIHYCTFISNVDSNNCGNAIYFFSDIMDIETVLTIDSCLFTKNGNTEDGNIYSIVSNAPYLICKNSIFESSSNSHLVSGVRIEADTKTALIEKCQFLNNYGFSSIDIRVNSSRQIDIIDTLFVMSLSSISAINYNPYTESTNESDYIHINNCEFRNCLTSCFFIDAKSGSAETIIVEKTNFMSSSITSSSSVIAFGTNSDSIKLNVKDCLFKNSGQDNNQYSDIFTLRLISMNAPSIESIITIVNNTFESDSHNCGPLINLEMPNRDVLIHNCSFIRTRYHENDPFANCIVADRLSKLNISKCIFFECGNDGNGNTDQGNVIGIGKLSDPQDFTVEGIDCYVENCIFNHTSSTISSYSEAVTFIGNTLYKVGKNSLRISASKTRDNKGFVFTDNILTNLNKGVIINSWKYGLMHRPIIRNNTFKHISTVYALYDDPNNEEKIYGFYFTVDGDIPIVFENNTFRDIRTCCGGFGGYFRQTSTAYTNINLTFINCSFEDSTQTNDDHFNNNGGAFLLNNNYNYGNVYLTFSECCFNNNEAKGEGGALYLSSCTKDILIEKCVFDSNKALRGGAVYICDMIESNVVFNECEFNNNYASFGAQAIHGVHSMHQIILKNALFNDNVNLMGDYNDENQQCTIYLEVASIEISDIIFDSTLETYSYPILFKNLIDVNNIEFTNVSSTYSSIIYVPYRSFQNEMTFNNLTFIDCECKEYIIDTYVSSFFFNYCIIEFSNLSKACGAIQINSHGTIEAKSSNFTNTKSLTGAIHYKPESVALSSPCLLRILLCIFNQCNGGAIYINTKEKSVDNIIILNNIFKGCVSLENNEYTCIANNNVNGHNDVYIAYCQFFDCGEQTYKKLSVILIQSPSNVDSPGEIDFLYSRIEFSTYTRNCVALKVLRKTTFRVTNDTFIRCNRKGDEKPWANTISVNLLNTLKIHECHFYECGMDNYGSLGGGGNVIGILGTTDISIKISNCTFIDSSSAISSYCESITILGNLFKGCGRNTIRITHQSGYYRRGFELIENKFIESRFGCIIHTWYEYQSQFILYPPVIKGNLFDNVTINEYGFDDESDFIFIFKLKDMNTISFVNNTFRNFHTIDGGFASKFVSESSIQLNLKDCIFDSCSRPTNGGAFCSSTSQNEGKIHLTFEGCLFISNSAEGNGGALFLETALDHDVNITRCHFISNEAASNSNNGFGGAIYISEVLGKLTITGCEFEDNIAKEGQAIYGTNSLTQFILAETEFFNNVKLQNSNVVEPQYMIVLNTGSLEISNVNFSCDEENNKIAYPILFKSTNEIKDIKFDQVSSSYSSILYIVSDNNNDEITFINLSFDECECKEYVIDVFVSKATFSECNIIFSEGSDKACGGIRINKYGDLSGEINIENSTFSNTQSETGCIYYKPEHTETTIGYEKMMFTILRSKLDHCKGGLYINPELNSDGSISIIETIFNECYSIIPDNHYFSAIGCSQNSTNSRIFIQKCIFHDCSDQSNPHGSVILISTNYESSPIKEPPILRFEFNIIEFTNSETRGLIALRIYQKFGHAFISNSSFTRCFKTNDEYLPWANTISAGNLESLTISECNFSRCGCRENDMNSEGGNVIGIFGLYDTIAAIRNCTFDTTSAVISTYCENTMFIGNKIIKCSRNTFRASHQSGFQGLQLIENHFCDITNGCVINAWYYADLRIQYPPIIVGNTFENIRTDPFGYDDGSKYAFVFDLDVVNSLLFEKNTFRNISTKFGGFAGHITSTTGPINLTFVDCYFDQNKQDIDNSNSINGGGFCSTSGLNDGNIYLSFIKCQFTENEVSKGNGGAIFIDTELSAYISECQFISNKALSSEENNGLGGAIYISKVQSELTITGCEFEFNSAKEGQAIYSIDTLTQFILTKTNLIDNFNSKINDKEQYMIVLNTDEIGISHIRFTSLNQKSYPILFKDMPIISNIEFNDVNSTNTALIVIPSYQDTNVFDNVTFINCYSYEYIIHTKGSFSYFNSKILFNQHSNVKAILLENGKNIQLSNIYVKNCCGGVLVEQNIETASIVNCTFFDCYYINENEHQAVVIIIENNECTFTQNVIDFTSKDRSIAGIWVKNHGNIEISSNHFLRVRNTFGNNGGAININEYNLTSTENVVRFNYNIIEQTANDQFSVFSVDKNHSFNIDHNCIKNCSINGYMCNLNLQGHIQNNHEFTFTNLSLIGCGTYSLAGGGLGLWFLFDNKEGKLSFNNCRFENNFAEEYLQSGGCGGSFECGSSTLHKVELIFDNCDFISNRAVKYGGALAISSTKQAIITNCRFEKNEAEEGGGAIYVYPKKSQGLNLPKCTISNCNFSSNIDKSCLNGHAILFKEFTGADTEFIIEENCQFIDNGDLQSNNLKGYTIVSAASTFQFKDSTIRFTNIERSTAGLKLEGSGNGGAILFQSTRDCKFINCQAENGGALYIKYEDLSLTNPVDSTDDLVIENCIFDNCVASNNGGGIYLRIKTQSFNNICVNSCIFNNCQSTNNQCFDLSVLNGITFKNNTIKNMISTGNSYFGQIKNSSDIASQLHEIVFDEITFINNVCDSLFGGGSGLIIQSEKIVFNGCKFINNIAIQNKNLDEQRPQPDGIDAVYYNGDGGGIQIGYLNSTSKTDLEFISCNFTKNKASKHGGAIAIQTLKTVNIINCTFDSNIADNRETSLSLLSYQNHFDKKKEGRGGAIYINPTFSYHKEGEIYPPENDHMKEINIRNCTFILNKAFDGFAIYIEGDEPENDFKISIIYNEFINNNQINGDDDVNKSFRALIASEVSLPHREIGNENTFDPPSNITLVDHYGNLIQIFSVPSTGEDIPTYNTEIVTTSSETIDTSTEIYSSTETDSLTETDSISFSESTEIFESSSLTQTDEISLSIISPKVSDDFISYHPTDVSTIDSEQKTTENYFESSLTNTQINSDVDFTSSTTNNGAAIGSSNKKKGLSIGAIIGIVCGIVVVVIAVVSVSVFLLVKRRKIPKNSFHDEMSNRNESKSTKSITIDRDDEDVDLNFWL